eukprot:TRINITY_DN3096_c0_g1_i2.p3 TRINITY_DN3096_c0_g1~~TRINITY_DN3096_c0_g1_i2.p3  ORF type:complete len:123 (-),score=4.88 TRINITY_DN3096_c0_g1_i2:231-599(-)
MYSSKQELADLAFRKASTLNHGVDDTVLFLGALTYDVGYRNHFKASELVDRMTRDKRFEMKKKFALGNIGLMRILNAQDMYSMNTREKRRVLTSCVSFLEGLDETSKQHYPRGMKRDIRSNT